MSGYDDDLRVEWVTAPIPSADVTLADGGTGLVWRRGDGQWVASRDAAHAVHLTADEAIRSLIGDPQ